jgi:hypothetical protein
MGVAGDDQPGPPVGDGKADLVAVSTALEHIRLIVLADCDDMRRKES